VTDQFPPPWYHAALAAGLKPFLATSESLVGAFDLAPWGCALAPIVLEDDANATFLRAYLCAERLAYGGWAETAGASAQGYTGASMPDWVFVDCVLLQSAAVGFMVSQDQVPAPALRPFAEAGIDLDRLPFLPLTADALSVRLDRRSIVGVSTYTLQRLFFGTSGWAAETHALALGACRAATYDWFYAVTQFGSHAIRLHGRFGHDPILVKPSVPIYPDPHLSFIYKMKIEFDPSNLAMLPVRTPDRLLRARDTVAKRRIAEEIAQGWRHTIVPPYWSRGDDVAPAHPYLSLCVGLPA